MTNSPTTDAKTNNILTKAAELVDEIVDLREESVEWEEVKFYVWLRDLQLSVAYKERDQHNIFTPARYDLDFATRVIDAVGDEHGRWQNLECHAVKAFLVDLDKRGTGRIPLTEFYQAHLDGGVPPPFRFIESAAYLKHLGSLDDTTDPRRPSVIIPNYVNARSNCVSSRSSYDICCIDACEDILQHIEEKLAGPTATLDTIVSVVEKLGSETVDAPRQLSPQLLERLAGIAQSSDGWVSIHGRMFAQWLHYAYPYECSFPHASTGDQNEMLQTADVWLDADMSMTEEQVENAVRDLMKKDESVSEVADGEGSMWADEEVSFTDDKALADSARQKFSHNSARKSNFSKALPAVVMLLIGAGWFVIWASKTLAQAKRAVRQGVAEDKWNKQVLFT